MRRVGAAAWVWMSVLFTPHDALFRKAERRALGNPEVAARGPDNGCHRSTSWVNGWMPRVTR
jgi:hypothetical protein